MSMLICAEDYLDEATRTASSEDAEFPASNLYDQSIRGRVWRSAGNFEVTSANKTIKFYETAATPLTATIAEATYSNLSDFLDAVKAALDAAGASTYTVIQNPTTKKINITSDHMGGGGIFSLLWTNVGTTAADLLGYDNSTDDTGAFTYTADSIRIHTSEWLKWDLGASSNPDIFIAIGKKGSAIGLGETATIKLQGNTTDVWTSPQYEQTLTYDEMAIYIAKTLTDGLHSSALRYWRLYIVDKDNAAGYVELSNVYLGEHYATTQGQPQFPFSVTGSDASSETVFQSGAKSYLRRQRGSSFSFSWLGLTTIEKEQFDSFQADLGNSKNFYLVFDPAAVFSSTINYAIRYVRFNSDQNANLSLPNVWDSDWSLDEAL